jgi:phosphatidate cytidylyltransferase
MTSFLRSLAPDQQVAFLFAIVFGLLLLASIAMWIVTIRSEESSAAHREDVHRLNVLLRNSWVMMAVFWIGWVLGTTVATVMFGLVAFFALREFITLSPTRRGDHRSLILAFFVVLPVQFVLVAGAYFELIAVFVPVYVFFAIPVMSALANDPHRFLERNAKLQWGIMVCVYGLSHVPALLWLEFPGYSGRGAFLLFFLVVVVQGSLVIQHLITRRLPHSAVAPEVSASFHWRGWWYGLFFSGLIGAVLSGITPFKPGHAFLAAVGAAAVGTLGHMVMKALKRDRGVKSWGGHGAVTTGASGLLDRVDGLCFAAPLFFHTVRWYYGA